MLRPPFTSADLAVLRSAHAAEPQPRAPQQQPSNPQPFWGLLAQKLGALLGARGPALAARKSPSRG